MSVDQALHSNEEKARNTLEDLQKRRAMELLQSIGKNKLDRPKTITKEEAAEQRRAHREVLLDLPSDA